MAGSRSLYWRRAFERLVTQSDAPFNNPRGDLVAKLGLNDAALAHLNPAIGVSRSRPTDAPASVFGDYAPSYRPAPLLDGPAAND